MIQKISTPLLYVFALLLNFSAFAKTTKLIRAENLNIDKTNVTLSIDNNINTYNNPTTNFAANAPELNNLATHTSAVIDPTLFTQGFFYGFTAMMILVNLICFYIFSDKVFSFLGASLITISLLLFNTDGLISLMGSNVNSFLTPINTALICIATGIMALFTSSFSSINDYYPKMKLITKPLFIIGASMALMTWFFENTVFSIISIVLSFVLIGIYFSATVLLFNKNIYTKIYVISSSIPLLIAIDYFLLGDLGIQFLNTQTIHIKSAFFIEMLLMTYATLYRMQAVKEESLIRKTEMQIFLKRQETLSRESIMQMVEDVYLENLIMHYDLDGVEIKLLQFISEEKTNTKIARKLNTTETEVESMTKDLYRKLEINEAVKEDFRMLEQQPDYLYN